MAIKRVNFYLTKQRKRMIKNVIDYLTKGFGEIGECESVRLPRSMPLIISSGYKFYKCRILSVECAIAVAADGAVHTPRRVQKQLAQVEAELNKPVVFVTDRLHPHDKERYIALRMPIVAPGKFAYLPFAGAMQDTTHRDFVLNRDTLSSVAQLVVLAFLEHRLPSPITVKDAAALLGFSAPAIQNAYRELECFGFGTRVKRLSSRALDFVFAHSGRALWDRARPRFLSPVRKTVGLLSAPTQGCVVAGVDALAAISRLNDQPPTVFATALDGFGKRGVEVVSAVGAPYKLQLWAYAPQRLGGCGVDFLSLVLSLADERDDRVQIEIERLMEEFQW